MGTVVDLKNKLVRLIPPYAQRDQREFDEEQTRLITAIESPADIVRLAAIPVLVVVGIGVLLLSLSMWFYLEKQSKLPSWRWGPGE